MTPWTIAQKLALVGLEPDPNGIDEALHFLLDGVIQAQPLLANHEMLKREFWRMEEKLEAWRTWAALAGMPELQLRVEGEP